MRRLIRDLGTAAWKGVLIVLLLPYICGLLSYGTTFSGNTEAQLWLDDVQRHLIQVRANCDDPELKKVLDYTIKRYYKIGPFDVAVSSCGWCDRCSIVPEGMYVIGMNAPWCPGLTLDQSLLEYPIEVGAVILVHEVLHEHFPYFGHYHVYPMTDKLEDLQFRLKHQRPRKKVESCIPHNKLLVP